MAKSKNSGKARLQTIDTLDDIDLLNLYRYPEFYPMRLRQELKNSKAAQKRLEDLLKVSAHDHQSDRYRRHQDQPIVQEVPRKEPEEEAETEQLSDRRSLNEILKNIRKLIP